MTETVLVVEDDALLREALDQTLTLAGWHTIAASSFIIAKDHIAPDFAGIVLSDIRMPGRDGLFLLDYVRSIDPDLPVILLTGEGDIPMAVDAIDRGAFGFLEKPCSNDVLIQAVHGALNARTLELENRRLRAEVTKGDAAARMIIGQSVQVSNLRDQVRRIAGVDGAVLINGAPGTGVSKIAEVLHLLSARSGGPFARHSAAGLAADDLFATVEATSGGCLFLDEIAGLEPAAQFALLNTLDTTPKCRILAGTTSDLPTLAQEGRFSDDLFIRLEALSVRIPSLKERPEDIPVLFRHYVAQACEQAGIAEPPITTQDIAGLMAQDWPGNARALMNAAMRFALGLGGAGDQEDLGLVEKMAQVERALLIDALRRQGGNASATAAQLKLPRKTLYDKFARHAIKPEDYR